MAGIVLSVKPEELEAEVENMRAYLRTLKVHFDAINDTMKNTGNYWRGDAGDTDRIEFEIRLFTGRSGARRRIGKEKRYHGYYFRL